MNPERLEHKATSAPAAAGGFMDFQTLAEALPHAVAIVAPGGAIRYANTAWKHIAGTVGLSACVHPADRTAFGELCGSKERCEREIHVRGADGRYRVYRMHIAPLPLRGHFMLSLMDVDDAVLAKQRFTSIIRSNMLGIVITDFKDRIIEANDAFLTIVGYESADLAEGRLTWSAISPLEYAALDESKVRQLHNEGAIVPFEKEYKKKDGTRVPVIVGASLLDQEEGTGVCFVLDITERKAHETRKDDFISTASHELKTPLTSQKINVQLLRRQVAKNEHVAYLPALEKIEAQVDKLTKLVSDLLDVSRIQKGRLFLDFQDVDLTRCVSEAIEEIVGISERHTIKFSGMIQRHVRGDFQRLSQVVTNLLSNAMKYSPAPSVIKVTLKETRNEAILTVADQGIGIEEQYMPYLFERFFRVGGENEKTYPGMGIGLHIVAEIVKRHGGTIEAASIRGKGSTFTVRLPLLA